MSDPNTAASTARDFLTSHAHVLICVARDPTIRLRDIATTVGLGERQVHRIVVELAEEGHLRRERSGRRTVYRVGSGLPVAAARSIEQLIVLFRAQDDVAPGTTSPASRGRSPREPSENHVRLGARSSLGHLVELADGSDIPVELALTRIAAGAGVIDDGDAIGRPGGEARKKWLRSSRAVEVNTR